MTGGPRAHEWAAEQAVDAARAATLIGNQFPGLRGAAVTPLAEGWDNTVHLVDGVWAFRFPRRAIALDGLQREIALLPRLAPSLPLPVPHPEWVGVPADGYPWAFFGARLLPGRELADATLPDAEREPLATALGAFLRDLHRPGLAAELGGDLPVDPMRRADPGHRGARARERLDRLRARGTWAGDGRVDRLLAGAASVGPSTAPPVLVHGDLHLRHVLVDDSGAAAGVIDWGDVALADPCVDLSVAYAAFCGDARDALLAAYGDVVADDRETRARVLAVNLCAALADYADTDGRPALLAESLAGLGRAVA